MPSSPLLLTLDRVAESGPAVLCSLCVCQLYEQLRDDAQCSRVEVGHVLQDLLRQLLGQPTLTWAQTDPHHWLGDPTQPRLEHKNEFRDRLLALMDEVEAGKGWKRLLDHRPLAVAAGRGTCLAVRPLLMTPSARVPSRGYGCVDSHSTLVSPCVCFLCGV